MLQKNLFLTLVSLFTISTLGFNCFSQSTDLKETNNIEMYSEKQMIEMQTLVNPEGTKELATLGGGCFWCVEAVYQELEGVEKVVSGYTNGHVKNPAYREVCNGTTGHAEVVQITFDPAKISFAEILDVFWHVHDPTTLNRQGNDVGTQYRSGIYYHSEDQKTTAEASKKHYDAEGLWADPFVTEIVAFDKLYEAEKYHQDYFSLNPNQPYCTFVVAPKVKKFKAKFADKLKKSE